TRNPAPLLRICHLGKYYPPAAGGIEEHVRTLARGQARLGAEVEVVCVNHTDAAGSDQTWRRWARTPTIREVDQGLAVTRVGRVGTLAKLDLSPSLLEAVSAAARRADVIHLHTPNPTMLLALAVTRPRATVVITHHSDVVRQR